MEPILPQSTLIEVLDRINENQAAIKEVQAMLEDLLLRQSSLSSSQRLLEQQAVLHALTNLGKAQSDAWPPISSLLIHRCTTHWRSFSTSEHGASTIQLSSFLESILDIIERGEEGSDDDKEDVAPDASCYTRHHAYWLNASLTLLLLFPAAAKATEHVSAVASLGRHLKGLYDTVQSRSFPLDPPSVPSPPPVSSEVTRKELFRSRLHKICINSYSMILAALKKDLSFIIPSCVQVLPQSQVSSPSFDSPSSSFVKRSSAWMELIDTIDTCVNSLMQQGLDGTIVDLLLSQALHFIDFSIFNQLLLRPECCLVSNARFMQAGLEDLDKRLLIKQPAPPKAPPQQQPQSPPHLSHSRQALAFLCHPAKALITIKDLRYRICPALTSQQIYRLATVSFDDIGDGGGLVDGEILEDLKANGGSSGNGGLVVTFLLEEETSPAIATREGQLLPEILWSMSQGEGRGPSSLLKGFITPPELLSINGVCEGPFEFLQRDFL